MKLVLRRQQKALVVAVITLCSLIWYSWYWLSAVHVEDSAILDLGKQARPGHQFPEGTQPNTTTGRSLSQASSGTPSGFYASLG